MPNSNPAVNCTVVTLRLSLTGPAGTQREGKPGSEDAESKGEIGHLRRHPCPLGRHKVTAPQRSCGAGPEQATAAAASASGGRGRSGLCGPGRLAARGWCGARDQCLSWTLFLQLTIKRTPTRTNTSAVVSRTNRAALKLFSSPKRKAPHTNAVMMFSGVHDPAAWASPMASEARKSRVVPRRPDQPSDERQPELAPTEREVATAGDQSNGGKNGIADRHVKRPRALGNAGQGLGQWYPRPP